MCAPWRMSTGAVLALVMGICARAPGASLAKTSSGRIIPLLKPADNFPIPSDTPIFPAPALLSRPSPRNLLGLDRQSPHGLPKLALQHERVLVVCHSVVVIAMGGPELAPAEFWEYRLSPRASD